METSSTKKKRKRVWNKLGHKFAKSLINEANKLINVGVNNDSLNKKLIDITKRKMKKKDADDVRDIAEDAIEFMEEIALKLLLLMLNLLLVRIFIFIKVVVTKCWNILIIK